MRAAVKAALAQLRQIHAEELSVREIAVRWNGPHAEMNGLVPYSMVLSEILEIQRTEQLHD
jgi:hypothetical protein